MKPHPELAHYANLWDEYRRRSPDFPTLADTFTLWCTYRPSIAHAFRRVKRRLRTGPPWRRRSSRFAPLVLSGAISTNMHAQHQRRSLRQFNRAMFIIAVLITTIGWYLGSLL